MVLNNLGWLVEFEVAVVVVVRVVDAVLTVRTADDRVMNELKVVDDDLNRMAALCISEGGGNNSPCG